MKLNRIVFLLAFFATTSGWSQNATDLIISEYCEYNHTVSPQFYNHYIELYNGTGAAVDMSQYQLWRSLNATGWNNNAGTPVAPLALHGMLPTGATYVITRPDLPSTPISIAADSTQSWDFLNISGDDAIGLAKNDGTGNFVLIDLLGSETIDPGTGWTVNGVADATYNHTLIRNPNVCSPTIDWAFSAANEWQVMPENDISNIGQHAQDCNWTAPQADTISALFLGNSYTYYNDMPSIVAAIASSAGDVFLHDQNTIGGYTFEDHWSDATSKAKVLNTEHDFVILQEQSTRPVRTTATVEQLTFPYAHLLDSLRKVGSPCGQTLFYRTWGHKFGYTSNCTAWPDPCTYEGMDSLLALRYGMMQDQNEALISPVGTVWRYIRDNHPTINLYDPDNSHPTAEGSYLSAITFYTVMFKKDPSAITYDFSLSASDAQIIREAAKAVVFDSLFVWNDYKDETDPCDSIPIIDGIEKIDERQGFQFYPNPAKGMISVIMDSEVSNLTNTLSVISISGQLIKTERLHQSENLVSLLGINPGLYLIQLQSNVAIYVRKLVVE